MADGFWDWWGTEWLWQMLFNEHFMYYAAQIMFRLWTTTKKTLCFCFLGQQEVIDFILAFMLDSLRILSEKVIVSLFIVVVVWQLQSSSYQKSLCAYCVDKAMLRCNVRVSGDTSPATWEMRPLLPGLINCTLTEIIIQHLVILMGQG